jgi:hypothetical protein
MKTAKLVMVLLLFALTLATESNAQESISAEKKALIKELLVVTDAKNNAEKVLDSILLQMEKEMPRILMQTSSQDPRVKRMSAQERAALKKYIDESSVRIGNRFRELVPQRLNFAETIEQISYSLYDKFFTEGELKDLIVFYGSATGKKSIKVMPQLMAESMQRYSELAMPKILQLISEISEEEMKFLLK